MFLTETAWSQYLIMQILWSRTLLGDVLNICVKTVIDLQTLLSLRFYISGCTVMEKKYVTLNRN